eukprot:gb/GECG01009130.1/.p1 GENE.gb/GECG01009130.1/~~gb/GECG01009130.1/.p1  ORF type:complete len:791 (+),score=83.23 gb/GECG01009130.1/:1-2373(+)
MSFEEALEIVLYYQRNPLNEPLFSIQEPIFIQPSTDSEYYVHDETNILVALPVHRLMQLSLNLPPRLQVAIVKVFRERNGLPSYPKNASTSNFINHLGFTNDEILHQSITIDLLKSMGVKIPVVYERCMKLISTDTKALAAHTCRRMSLSSLQSDLSNASDASALTFMLKHVTGTKLTRFHKLFKSSYKLHVSEKVAFAYDQADVSVSDWARYRTVIKFALISRVERAGGTAHFAFQEIYNAESEDPQSEETNWWLERTMFESLSALDASPVKMECQRLFGDSDSAREEQIAHTGYWARRDLALRSVCDAFRRIPVDIEVSTRYFTLITADEVPAPVQERYRRFKEALHHPLTGSWNDVWTCRASFPPLAQPARYQRTPLPDKMVPACYRAVLASLMIQKMATLGSVAMHGNVLGYIDRVTYLQLAHKNPKCTELLEANLTVQESAALAAGSVQNLAKLSTADMEKREEHRRALGCSAALLVSERHWALFYNILPFTMLSKSLQHVEAYNVMFQADGVYSKRKEELIMKEDSLHSCVDVSSGGISFNICKKDFRDFLKHCVHENIFEPKSSYENGRCGLPTFMITEIMTACHSSSVYVGHAEGIGAGAWPGLGAALYSATAGVEAALDHFRGQGENLPFGFLPIMGKSATWTTSTLATFIATAPLQWSSNDLPLHLYYYMGNLTAQVLDSSLPDYRRLDGGLSSLQVNRPNGYFQRPQLMLRKGTASFYPLDSLEIRLPLHSMHGFLNVENHQPFPHVCLPLRISGRKNVDDEGAAEMVKCTTLSGRSSR